MKQLLSIVCVIGLTLGLRSFFHVEGVDMAFIGALLAALATAGTATAATAATTAVPAAAGAAGTAGAATAAGAVGPVATLASAAPLASPVAAPVISGGASLAKAGVIGGTKVPSATSGLIPAVKGGGQSNQLFGAINAANTGQGGTSGILNTINTLNPRKPGLLDMLGKKLLSTAAGSSIGFNVGNTKVNVGPSRERRLRRSMRMLRSGGRGNAFLDELIGATMLQPNTDRARAVTSPMRGA